MNFFYFISAADIEYGEEALARAASAIKAAYQDTDADVDIDDIVDIDCSFDGTWQKCGFMSLYGVGVVMDVLTGLVVDYEVLSLYCHTCVINKARKPPEEFRLWKQGHEARRECSINHEGSSMAMEKVAAERLRSRSEERGFHYRSMLSDRDSVAFKAVVDLQVYPLEKLECDNHTHKRMGSALRKLTKESRLGGRGEGRLTAAKCESLQHYYRGAILNNLGDTERMKSAVWATLLHCILTDDEPHHNRCDPAWCVFRWAEDSGETPPSHADHVSSCFLTNEVAEQMLPVYTSMSDHQLLSWMCHGGTQNQNESLNSHIWLRCPKTTFMGKARVNAAVARVLLSFNEGTIQLSLVMNKLWLEPVRSTLERLSLADDKRAARADAANLEQAREQRRQHQDERQQNQLHQENQEGPVYGAGMME